MTKQAKENHKRQCHTKSELLEQRDTKYMHIFQLLCSKSFPVEPWANPEQNLNRIHSEQEEGGELKFCEQFHPLRSLNKKTACSCDGKLLIAGLVVGTAGGQISARNDTWMSPDFHQHWSLNKKAHQSDWVVVGGKRRRRTGWSQLTVCPLAMCRHRVRVVTKDRNLARWKAACGNLGVIGFLVLTTAAAD